MPFIFVFSILILFFSFSGIIFFSNSLSSLLPLCLMHKSHLFFVWLIILLHISGVMEFQILWIPFFSSSIEFGGNIFSIPFIIDHTSSIADKSGELGGHFGIFCSLISFSLSHVGIKFPLKSLFISIWEAFEEWARAPSCWKILSLKLSKSSL